MGRARSSAIARSTFAARGGAPGPGGPAAPQGHGGLSLGIGLELFSMDDLAAMRAPGFVLPDHARERLTFLQTPSDLCSHLDLAARMGSTHRRSTHVSACAAGTDAIGGAFRMVASGRRAGCSPAAPTR